jgi:hypothetical protein
VLVALLGAIAGCSETPPEAQVPCTQHPAPALSGLSMSNQLDVLFVVDNAPTTVDLEQRFAQSIPLLVQRLLAARTDTFAGRVATNIDDVHIGVITSSLGAFGTGGCRNDDGDDLDDRAHLMPRSSARVPMTGWTTNAASQPIAARCPAIGAASAVTWARDMSRTDVAFSGADAIGAFATAVSCAVLSAGNDGCMERQPLAAAARFLVDPEPTNPVMPACAANPSDPSCDAPVVQGAEDTAILAQRSGFLRKGSVLLVVTVSDRDDESVVTTGDTWIFGGRPPGMMTGASPGCASLSDSTDSDSFIELDASHCVPCAPSSTDTRCRDREGDPIAPLDAQLDPLTLRSFQPIQRFGQSNLVPRSSYQALFSETSIIVGAGALVPNPLFADQRTTDMVIVASFAGVPQALLGESDGVLAKLDDASWSAIGGADIAARDPHMIEATSPRPNLPLFNGNPSVDPAGGERQIPNGDALEYACIGPRLDTNTTVVDPSCPTQPGDLTDPLCTADGRRLFYGVEPGLRTARVLESIGGDATLPAVALESSCAPDFSGAMGSIASLVESRVDPGCLTIAIDATTDGDVPCIVSVGIALQQRNGASTCEAVGAGLCTPGTAPCRSSASGNAPTTLEVAAGQIVLQLPDVDVNGLAITRAVTPYVRDGALHATAPDGTDLLVCEGLQLAGSSDVVTAEDAASCKTDPTWNEPSTGGGWCFSADSRVVGAVCQARGAVGALRFFGPVTPSAGVYVTPVCTSKC